MRENNRTFKIIIFILSILLIGSSAFLFVSLEEIKQKDASIAALSVEVTSQQQQISQLGSNISNLKEDLSRKEALLRNETQTRQKLEKEIINITMVTKSDYGVLGVDDNNIGHVIPLEVIIKDGNGKLFLDVANILADESMQSSAQTAIRVAREVTRTSLTDKDIQINIKAPVQEEKLSISGGSAGGAITIAAIAAMMGIEPRQDVLMTGTISEDHSIGQIAAPRAKGIAARQNGAKLFIVPPGQKAEVGDIGIEVMEVRTIEEAVKYAI
ncbi:Lon protease 1 [Methanosarcinales archaeon]|nr:Lon protease 1 [Methanosarcinales archaeon]